MHTHQPIQNTHTQLVIDTQIKDLCMAYTIISCAQASLIYLIMH